jgi:hypothetical protein
VSHHLSSASSASSVGSGIFVLSSFCVVRRLSHPGRISGACGPSSPVSSRSAGGPSESSSSDCMHLIEPVVTVWPPLCPCHSSKVGLLPRGGPSASDADEESALALGPWSAVSSCIVAPGVFGPLLCDRGVQSVGGPIGGLS